MNFKKLSKITDSLIKRGFKISDEELSLESLKNYLFEDVISYLNSGKIISGAGADNPGITFIMGLASNIKEALEDEEPMYLGTAWNLDLEDDVETEEELLEILKQKTSGEYFFINYDSNDTGDVFYCGYLTADDLKSQLFDTENSLFIPYGWYRMLTSLGYKLDALQFSTMCSDVWAADSFKDSKAYKNFIAKYEGYIKNIDYWDYLNFDIELPAVNDSKSNKFKKVKRF